MNISATDLRLSEEQLAAFHRDGFLHLPALTTPEEVASLRTVYDQLFARGSAAFADGDHLELGKVDESGQETLPQILNPEKYAPELVDIQARVNALAVARQLLGDEAMPAGDHAISKPPAHGAPTPWHQDEAYWSPAYDHTAISVWMPLQEATMQNGCMQFVPGSHRSGVVPHELVDPDAHALQVADPITDDVERVAVPLPAGGCTIHHCRTLHYAGANTSDGTRRAYIMGFLIPATPRDRPHHYPWQRPEWGN
ncbi:phytanoyl-CoA dioxygenase family protein [Microlunatus speluncae]|uniref:phytanoyl-CoA dioxygenase family protein n=1 Tax=Microlunatus speluncae TaxID=2594267 RepID=UPI0012662B79|nr:phytanoyl-CoA dioxygenase family protein [Microlunatus speluncae]